MHISIELRVARWAEDRARLIVRDHGIGVSPAALERIFGRFERAVSSREAPFVLELPSAPPPASYGPPLVPSPWSATTSVPHPM